MTRKRLTALGILVVVAGLVYFYVTLTFNYYEVTPFDVEISASETSLVLSGAEPQEIFVSLKNNSRTRLSVEDRYFLSYHVYGTGGNEVAYDNDRTPFEPLSPKGTLRDIPLLIKPMPEKGSYVYKIDIVQEEVAWYSNNNNPTFDLTVVVE